MEHKIKNIHPGTILKDLVLDEKGISICDGAQLLKLTGTALSDILNAKTDISVDISLRIAAVFGGTAAIWQRLQHTYNAGVAHPHIAKLKLRRYVPKLKKALLIKETKSRDRKVTKVA